MKCVLKMHWISLLPKYIKGILNVFFFMLDNTEWAWYCILTMQNA